MQRALDLLAVAEFGLVVVAIAKFRLVGRFRLKSTLLQSNPIPCPPPATTKRTPIRFDLSRQVFYSAWVWWLLLAVRGVFTVDLVYRAFRSTSPKHFLVVR